MNDEKYVFIEDVKERKSIARGAFHKKGGAKSKKCTLPSDYLTRKEREKMNGEVKSWNLNEFYSWDEFKEMPSDIAAAYISTLNQKYHVSMSTIAKELFNIVDSTFSVYLHKHGIFNLLNVKRYSNNSSTVEEFKNAMKKEKETSSTEVFIPDGMAPGYTSDGKKIEESKDECLFFDSYSNRSFWATKDAVYNAINKINKQIYRFPTVNDFYFILGIPPIEQGDTRGWRPEMREYEFNPCLRVDKTIDGKECIVIDYLPYYIDEFKKPNCSNDAPITRLNVTMNGIDSDRIADILSWFTGKDVMVTLIVNEKIGPDDLV